MVANFKKPSEIAVMVVKGTAVNPGTVVGLMFDPAYLQQNPGGNEGMVGICMEPSDAKGLATQLRSLADSIEAGKV